MPYPNRIIDLFNQRNPIFNQGRAGGPRLPIPGDIGPRPDIGPRYLKDDRPGLKSLADMFGGRDTQRRMPMGRPDERQGLSLGPPLDKKKRVIGGIDPRDRKDPREYRKDRPPGYKEKEPPPDDGGGGGNGDGDGFLTYDEWKKLHPDGNLEDYYNWIIANFGGDPGDPNPDDWNPDTGGYADPFGGRHRPDWLTEGEPGQGPPFPWLSDVGGEDTRALPRGFGMDWFDDLLRHFNWEGDWDSPAERQRTGGHLSMHMSANMLNIMNRIANQGVLGPEGRKFITSGDKRESQLRRKGLRKELERSIGKQLGPRGGGAIQNMLFNQLDAPDFARREGKAADLREFDMKSRMAGVEGLAQMLNFFEAMYKGEQTRATGGPGALSTIGDVGKIAASIAALL